MNMAHHGQVETLVCFSGNGEQLCAAIQRLVPPETIAREVLSRRGLGLRPGYKDHLPIKDSQSSRAGKKPEGLAGWTPFWMSK